MAARLKLTFSLCHSSLARSCKTMAARNARSASLAAAGPRYTQLCGIPQTALIYVLPVSAYGLYIYCRSFLPPPPPTNTHALARASIRIHTHIHALTRARTTRARNHAQTYIHISMHAHTDTHMHEHAHARARAHTHTHTHSSYFDAWFEQSRLFWALV